MNDKYLMKVILLIGSCPLYVNRVQEIDNFLARCFDNFTVNENFVECCVCLRQVVQDVEFCNVSKVILKGCEEEVEERDAGDFVHILIDSCDAVDGEVPLVDDFEVSEVE